ncbi:conserved Plasmodium protein, unknown function [Plasmodium berghei]|uniref:Uncharacterized protein n=1 Tax=Plasmodium berghei TaxID=5821 RepID=A0A0Y9TV29_PLABE|nr:conserved Plasmodium protein, unknown function [Plasmodium berghei]
MFYLYNKITSLSTKSQGGNEKRDNKENVTNCLDNNIDKNKNYEECYKKDEDIFLLFEDTKFENSNSINKNVNPTIKLDKNEVDKIDHRNENKLKVDLNKQDKLICESGKEDVVSWVEFDENSDNDDNFFKINQNNFCNFEFSNYNDSNHEDSKEKSKNSFPKFERNSSIDWSNINLKNNTKRYLLENIEDEFQNFNFENEDFDDYRTKDNEEIPPKCNIKNMNNTENDNNQKPLENEKIFKENSDFSFLEIAWNKCINDNEKLENCGRNEKILKPKLFDDKKVNEIMEINVSIKGKNSDKIISSILKKNELHENSFNLMESNNMPYKKIDENEIKEDPFVFKCESSYNNENNICEKIVKDYKNKENSFNKNIMHNDMHTDLIKNNIKNSEIVDNANFPNNNNDDLPNFENGMKVKKHTEHIESNYCQQNDAKQSDVKQNTIVGNFQENNNITPKKIHEIEEIKVNCSERENDVEDVMNKCVMEECAEYNDKKKCNSFDKFFYENQINEAEETKEKGNIESFLFEKNMSIIDGECGTSGVEKIKKFHYENAFNEKISTNLLIRNSDNIIQDTLKKEEEGKNKIIFFEKAKMCKDNESLNNQSKVNSLIDEKMIEINNNSNEGENCDVLEENELWVDNTFIKETKCNIISENNIKEYEADAVLNGNNEIFEKEDDEKILCDKENLHENELWDEDKQIKFSECKNSNLGIVIMNSEEEEKEKEEEKAENILCENNELFENKMLWGEKKIMKKIKREDSIGIFTSNQNEENIILKNKEIEIEKCSEKNEVKIDIENESLQIISLENKKNSEMNENKNNSSSSIEFHEIKKKTKSNNLRFDKISKENIHSKNNNLTSVNLSRFTYEKINEIKANNRKEKKSDLNDNEKKTDAYDISCNNMRNRNNLCNLKFNKINELEEHLSKERKEIINYCQDIDRISSENNNFIRGNEIKLDLNNNNNKKCNIISKKETKLKKKKKRNDDVENNINGKLASITNKFEYESNSLNFLKALKELPNLEFLKCKDLNPFLRYFNIVLKTVTICFNNEFFFYVLAGDETGCAYVKLRNEFRDLFKGNESFIIENCSVMEEGFHIILEMNKYSNIYPLKYNTIKNINKHINFSDAKFVSLSEHII